MKGKMLTHESVEAVYIYTHTLGSVKERRKEIWNKNQSNTLEKGITLVALVITIVVLLILAGITITYVFGENSVFNKASEAKEKTAIAKAREKLEVVLSEAQILKYSDPKYKKDEYLYLNEMILNKVPASKVKGDVAIVDGYAFTLDRSIPWIGEYAGEEKDLVFPELETSVTISTDKKTATITITAREEKNGMKNIEILQDGIVIKPYSYENEKGEITETYTITRNGKYLIKATAVLTATKIESITDLVSSVQYTPNGNTTWKKQHQVKVTAKENTEKVKSIKYQWTDSTVEPATNTFTKTIENGGAVTENTLTGKYYLWTLLEENDGNTRIEKSEAFWFDNTVPTAEIATEWLEEEGKNRLQIKVTSQDADSGINDNSVKMYINDPKQQVEIKLTNGEGSTTVDGLNMETKNIVKLSLADKAGNNVEVSVSTGRIYIFRNGKLLRGEFSTVNGSQAYITDDGLLYFGLRSYDTWSGNAGILTSWGFGAGTVNMHITTSAKLDQYGEAGYICSTSGVPGQGCNNVANDGGTPDVFTRLPRIRRCLYGAKRFRVGK